MERMFATQGVKYEAADENSLRGVSIITAGEAKGHGVHISREFLNEIVRLGNEKKAGIKARFGHPQLCVDAIGTELGRFTNFRLDENKVVADIEFIRTPANEKFVQHITILADKDPELLGTSIVFEDDGNYYDENGNTVEWDRLREHEKLFIYPTKLFAADFVDEPAANPAGLFTKNAADRRISAIIATEGAKLLDNFTNKLEKMGLFSKNKDDKRVKTKRRAMGEMQIDENNWLVYPGEIPQAGDAAIIKDNEGNEGIAAEGSYETVSGWVIVVNSEGIIESVTEPTIEDVETETTEIIETSANMENTNEYSAKLDLILNKFNEVDKRIQALESDEDELDLKPVGVSNKETYGVERSTRKRNGQPTDNEIYEVASRLFKSKCITRDGKPVLGQNSQLKRVNYNGRNGHLFAHGIDSSDTLVRQILIVNDLLHDLITSDGFLSSWNRITGKTPGANTQYKTMITGLVDDVGYGNEYWRIGGQDCEFDPSGSTRLSERYVDAIPIFMQREYCPALETNTWDGIIFVDDQTIPLAAQIIAILTAGLDFDLEKIGLFGRLSGSTAYQNIIGLFAQIQLGLALPVNDIGHISPMQSVSQTPYNQTNARQNLRDLFMPEHLTNQMMQEYNISVYCSNNIAQFFSENINAATFAYGSSSPLETLVEYLSGLPQRPALKRIFQMQLNPYTVNNTVVGLIENNIYYILEKIPSVMPMVWWDPHTRTVKLEMKNLFGVNYGKGSLFTTNITTSAPVTFIPNTLA